MAELARRRDARTIAFAALGTPHAIGLVGAHNVPGPADW